MPLKGYFWGQHAPHQQIREKTKRPENSNWRKQTCKKAKSWFDGHNRKTHHSMSPYCPYHKTMQVYIKYKHRSTLLLQLDSRLKYGFRISESGSDENGGPKIKLRKTSNLQVMMPSQLDRTPSFLGHRRITMRTTNFFWLAYVLYSMHRNISALVEDDAYVQCSTQIET